MSDLTLTWKHLSQFGKSDNGNRWYPDDRAPVFVHKWVARYRAPSRAWPSSYARALFTRKFVEHALAIDPAWTATILNESKNNADEVQS